VACGAVKNLVLGKLRLQPPAPSAARTWSTDLPAPYEGRTLYRVYGQDSYPGGASWTPDHPGTFSSYRDAAGLPSGGESGPTSSGRFLL